MIINVQNIKKSYTVGTQKVHALRGLNLSVEKGEFISIMGPSGSGQLTKMVNQICIAGLIQALAEGVNFSKKVGLNTQDVLEVVSKGAAQSWQMENRWETMIC